MKIFGYALFLIGIWMMVSPQATLGLNQLRWMAEYAFPAEALLGAITVSGALYLIGDLKKNTINQEISQPK